MEVVPAWLYPRQLPCWLQATYPSQAPHHPHHHASCLPLPTTTPTIGPARPCPSDLYLQAPAPAAMPWRGVAAGARTWLRDVWPCAPCWQPACFPAARYKARRCSRQVRTPTAIRPWLLAILATAEEEHRRTAVELRPGGLRGWSTLNPNNPLHYQELQPTASWRCVASQGTCVCMVHTQRLAPSPPHPPTLRAMFPWPAASPCPSLLWVLCSG